jgi:phytoene dehydrogenase-like protein
VLDAQVWDPLIIGAGAAGLAAATLCSQDRPESTLLIESHLAPGGCAGHFARGFPRRIHDAGATQLIECAPGGLQHELLRVATGKSASDVMPVLCPIDAIEHVWPDRSGAVGIPLRVQLNAAGKLNVRGSATEDPVMSEPGRMALERFLHQCHSDAALIWKIFYCFPDFPVRSFGGLTELLKLAPLVGLGGAFRLTRRLGASVADVAVEFGVLPGTPEWQIVAALLLDTSQNTPAATPYLVGAMGLSILRRGISRLPNGMRDLFDPWFQGIRASGVRTQTGARATQIRTRPGGGFEVDCNVRGTSVTFFAKNVICALPISSILNLVAPDDLLTHSKEWKVWDAASTREYEWQALALHGVVEGDSPAEFKGKPWYLQIFARQGEQLEHALYVSMAADSVDPRSGRSFRTFTASLHVDSAADARWRRSDVGSSNASFKDELQTALLRRIEQGTGLTVTFSELATPETFARYTNRTDGRVGGFAASFNNFLFRSLPRVVAVNSGSALFVAGDSVFPGQGVIAASMSGVIAWSIMTGKSPRVHLSQLSSC